VRVDRDIDFGLLQAIGERPHIFLGEGDDRGDIIGGRHRLEAEPRQFGLKAAEHGLPVSLDVFDAELHDVVERMRQAGGSGIGDGADFEVASGGGGGGRLTSPLSCAVPVTWLKNYIPFGEGGRTGLGLYYLPECRILLRCYVASGTNCPASACRAGVDDTIIGHGRRRRRWHDDHTIGSGCGAGSVSRAGEIASQPFFDKSPWRLNARTQVEHGEAARRLSNALGRGGNGLTRRYLEN
jgi:hypothetical protein